VDVAQPEAAFLNASLWSRAGLAFFTLAISDFMKMLYNDGARGAFSFFSAFGIWIDGENRVLVHCAAGSDRSDDELVQLGSGVGSKVEASVGDVPQRLSHVDDSMWLSH